MLETVGTYAPLLVHPREVEDFLLRDDSPWKVSQDPRTGALVGTLTAEHTPLGRVRIEKPRAADAPAAYLVQAEGNALTLLLGQSAKALTLPDAKVPAALAAYLAALCEAVPMASEAPESHRLIRVDPSATWRLSELVASAVLTKARNALNLERSGRKVAATYGVESVQLRITKRRTVRAYDKTAEMISAAKKSRTPLPDLGPGRLVRLEVQYRTTEARRLFGDNLHTLATTGAPMARKAIRTLADTFAGHVTTETADQITRRLITAGASPAEALRLIGPAMLIARGGVPSLTSLGLSEPSAYRLRARLRELLGTLTEEDAPFLDLDAAAFAKDQAHD